MTKRIEPKQGEVYLIEVYFRDADVYKVRPVVIVSNKTAIDIDVVMAPITGSTARSEYDVPINKWQEAGLDKPSVARTAKLLTYSKQSLRKKLGELQQPDLDEVLDKCAKVFDADNKDSE